MKAWIENNRIRDIAPSIPADIYHPDVAQFYNTDVPTDAVLGDGWVDGQLIKPAPLPPMPTPPRIWSSRDIRSAMKLSERVKWDNDSNPEIVTAKLELERPLGLIEVTEVLDLLIVAGIISVDTKINILK